MFGVYDIDPISIETNYLGANMYHFAVKTFYMNTYINYKKNLVKV